MNCEKVSFKINAIRNTAKILYDEHQALLIGLRNSQTADLSLVTEFEKKTIEEKASELTSCLYVKTKSITYVSELYLDDEMMSNRSAFINEFVNSVLDNWLLEMSQLNTRCKELLCLVKDVMTRYETDMLNISKARNISYVKYVTSLTGDLSRLTVIHDLATSLVEHTSAYSMMDLIKLVTSFEEALLEE